MLKFVCNKEDTPLKFVQEKSEELGTTLLVLCSATQELWATCVAVSKTSSEPKNLNNARAPAVAKD